MMFGLYEKQVAWQCPAATRFFKSIIHSRAAMTYAKAQTFLDDPALTGDVADGD